MVALIFLALFFWSTSAQTLQAFVIPHSHDDAGWLRTVDQYFQEEVRWVYTSVVKELTLNPQRKFVFVEIAFFQRWWQQQTNDTKSTVKQLISNGQLEVINGGWVMADEAITHYESLVNQWTLGHQWILNELGVTPKVGWHIDPFGLSASFAPLFHDLGYNAFVINRIDYRLKNSFKSNKALEFIWRGSPSRGTTADIFTHVLDSHYSAVSGFDWEYFDGLGGNEPDAPNNPWIIDSSTSASMFDVPNIDSRATAYVNELKNRANWYLTNNLLIPFGDDFKFQDANKQFSNFDRLMNYINSNSKFGVNIRYATVSDYVNAVTATQGVSWPLVTYDFFPYADSDSSYWTGFYTSRPTLKGQQHVATKTLHVADLFLSSASAFNLTSSTINPPSPTNYYTSPTHPLFVSREAEALNNHHDAITGTSNPPTVSDQQNRAATSISQSELWVANSLNLLLTLPSKTAPNPGLTSSSTPLAQLKNGQSISVVIVNPLGWHIERCAVVNIPINNVAVYDSTGKPITSQVDYVPWESTPYRVEWNVNLPPAGYITFFIVPVSTNHPHIAIPSKQFRLDHSSAVTSIENDVLRLDFDPTSGLVVGMTNKQMGIKTNLNQNFLQYTSNGDNAYIFTPMAGDNGTPISLSANTTATVGPVLQEMYQNFGNGISQEFRTYQNVPYPGGNYAVSKMVVTCQTADRELITRYTTSLSNKDSQGRPVFYTDANGLDYRQRTVNLTGWGSTDVTEPVSGNYYPISTTVLIRDTTADQQVTFVGDRGHGVSSLRAGEVEVMLQRRVNEYDPTIPLDDTSVNNPALHFFYDNIANSTNLARHMVFFYGNAPLYFYSAITNISSWSANYLPTFSILGSELPFNIHLLTFATMQDSTIATGPFQVLLRLQHIFAIDDNTPYANPVTIDLTKLFTCTAFSLCLNNIQEYSLSGTIPIGASGVTSVTLQPMTIRTFIATVSKP